MAQPKDLIYETATTTGTGSLTIAAVSGKVRFSDGTYGFSTGATTNVFAYFVSHQSASEWEIGYGHMSDANTLVRDTVVLSSNANAAVNFSAGTKDVVNDAPSALQWHSGEHGFDTPLNLSLAASAAASALTITLNGADGNAPSPSNPIEIPFRNVTEATGTPTWLSVTAATTLVISSGSTMGVTSSTAFRIWVVGFNDGGTFRIGAINCSVSGTAATIYPLTDWIVASSTAEGGAGAADSAGVFYTGTAVTSKSYRVLGFIEWNATGLTAGTWTTTNLNRIQLFSPCVHLPGAIVQFVLAEQTSNDTTTSTTFVVTSSTVSITPKCAANLIKVGSYARILTGSGAVATHQMSRGNTNNTNMIGTQTTAGGVATTTVRGGVALIAYDKPNTTSATAYYSQFATSTGTGTWGAGVNGEMTAEEIMS